MPADRPTVVLDCDPGHDDAMAIVLAAAHADLVGVTTVSGNAPLHHTTTNALRIVQLLGLDVEVHSGAARPLVAPARHAEAVHGDTGLDGATFPELDRTADGTDAVGFLIELSRRHDDLWLVAVGPLTNVALALRADPGFGERLAGISIMGGGVGIGNVTPAAEFNVWADPEAAGAVFDSGVPLRMCGLDLTHQFRVDDSTVAAMRAAPGATAAVAAGLFGFYIDAIERARGVRWAAMHDPCAVLAVTHPEFFEGEDLHVAVELDGRHTRGMTLADLRGSLDGAAPNVSVMRRIDAEPAMALFLDTVLAAP